MPYSPISICNWAVSVMHYSPIFICNWAVSVMHYSPISICNWAVSVCPTHLFLSVTELFLYALLTYFYM